MNDVPASKPDIKDGMIPVVISSNGITSTVSEDDASWYNYNNKEWANMVLVMIVLEVLIRILLEL